MITSRLIAFLNPHRLRYAWIAAGALYAGWIASLLLGRDGLDLAKQVIGTDYLQFYVAGYTFRIGESARLYDMAYQSGLQQQIIGAALRDYYAFLTPPFLAWLYLPFSWLPYAMSFVVWSLCGVLALAGSLRLLGLAKWRRGLAWSLSFFPVFAAISYGQNALLSLLLVSLAYWLWRRDRLLAAGLVAALLSYKPQLLIGVAVLWLLQWRRDWPALAGLALGCGALAGLCFWQLPDASRGYLTLVRGVLPGLQSAAQFPIWHLHTVRGFWQLLLPGQGQLVNVLALGCAGAGLLGFVLFWRRYREKPALPFAGALVLSIWLTPHAMIYDWLLLLAPAVLLWEHMPAARPQWVLVFSGIWLATFVAAPFTVLQLQLVQRAIQVTVPALLAAILVSYRIVASSAPSRRGESLSARHLAGAEGGRSPRFSLGPLPKVFTQAIARASKSKDALW